MAIKNAGRGRPKKATDEKLVLQLSVAMRKEEREEIARWSAELGMSNGSFVRMAILQKLRECEVAAGVVDRHAV